VEIGVVKRKDCKIGAKDWSLRGVLLLYGLFAPHAGRFEVLGGKESPWRTHAKNLPQTLKNYDKN
jgi:hypothetical protein